MTAILSNPGHHFMPNLTINLYDYTIISSRVFVQEVISIRFSLSIDDRPPFCKFKTAIFEFLLLIFLQKVDTSPCCSASNTNGRLMCLFGLYIPRSWQNRTTRPSPTLVKSICLCSPGLEIMENVSNKTTSELGKPLLLVLSHSLRRVHHSHTNTTSYTRFAAVYLTAVIEFKAALDVNKLCGKVIYIRGI